MKNEPIPYFLQYSNKTIGGLKKSNKQAEDIEITNDLLQQNDESSRRQKSIAGVVGSNTEQITKAENAKETNRTSRVYEKSEFMDESSREKLEVAEKVNNNNNNRTNDELVKFDVSQKIKM